MAPHLVTRPAGGRGHPALYRRLIRLHIPPGVTGLVASLPAPPPRGPMRQTGLGITRRGQHPGPVLQDGMLPAELL